MLGGADERGPEVTASDVYRVTFSASVRVLTENEPDAREKAAGLLLYEMMEKGLEGIFTLEDCRIDPART